MASVLHPMRAAEKSPHRLRIAWYGVTVFLSSAFLLVLEIIAGRLIAPYVGVSLYTWTSVIGVILAGLSIGNWLGGVWADAGGDERSAGLVLALGGVFCLASLLLLTLVAPMIGDTRLDLISASFLYVSILFFMPALLLGVVTPLLTTLALRLDRRSGHVVGRMHALAALGSIMGTFLTGYWLVQFFGTRAVVVGTAVGLLVLAVPYLWRAPRSVIAVLLFAAGAMIAGTHMRGGFVSPCDRESSYFCIRVVDVSRDAPFGVARALVLDHLLHGVNHRSEPEMIMAPYVHLMDELVRSHFSEQERTALRYFFAGGGSYTQPRSVKASTPQAHVTVAELDPAVTDIAAQKLFLDPEGIRIRHTDARVALQRHQGEPFDVVVTDVFHDVSVPFHLITREFAAVVRARLSVAGLYAVNIVDVHPDPLLVKSLVKTLQTQFRHVHAWVDHIPRHPGRVTYVVSASDTHAPPETVHAQHGFRRTWHRVTEQLINGGTALDELPVLTDDFVPVERLIADLLLSGEYLGSE